MPTPKAAPADALVHFNYVAERTGLTRTTIYRRIKAGVFPRPAKLGASPNSAARWSKSEIESWVQAHLAARSPITA